MILVASWHLSKLKNVVSTAVQQHYAQIDALCLLPYTLIARALWSKDLSLYCHRKVGFELYQTDAVEAARRQPQRELSACLCKRRCVFPHKVKEFPGRFCSFNHSTSNYRYSLPNVASWSALATWPVVHAGVRHVVSWRVFSERHTVRAGGVLPVCGVTYAQLTRVGLCCFPYLRAHVSLCKWHGFWFLIHNYAWARANKLINNE